MQCALALPIVGDKSPIGHFTHLSHKSLNTAIILLSHDTAKSDPYNINLLWEFKEYVTRGNTRPMGHIAHLRKSVKIFSK